MGKKKDLEERMEQAGKILKSMDMGAMGAMLKVVQVAEELKEENVIFRSLLLHLLIKDHPDGFQMTKKDIHLTRDYKLWQAMDSDDVISFKAVPQLKEPRKKGGLEEERQESEGRVTQTQG